MEAWTIKRLITMAVAVAFVVPTVAVISGVACGATPTAIEPGCGPAIGVTRSVRRAGLCNNQGRRCVVALRLQRSAALLLRALGVQRG